jgi:penicillin amidase
MRLLFNILGRGLAIVAVLAVALGGGGYFWLRRSLPQASGNVTVQGLAAPVTIVRDANGIPHITGQSEADALFGLGYAHAQDRLWQMEYQRRVGTGRLSEAVGAGALSADRFLRTLGTGRAAESAYQNLDPDTRALLDAYSAGVNAFLDANRGNLPPEFLILGITPEPWRPQDSLAWVKMMSWDLGGNWDEELARARFQAQVGPDAAEQLLPAAAADDPLILPDGGDSVTGAAGALSARNATPPAATRAPAAWSELAAIGEQIELGLGLGGEHVGSNNWVIAGSRSATGKPILADDPHLGTQIPALWYLAHVTGGSLDVAGATLPGLPGVVIGHNGRIAWGVTNTNPDVQDLFVERVNARNEALYRDQWEPLTVIPETIKVKGEEDVELFVRVSRHGPLISDVIDGTGDPLAFRWTALDPEDNTLRAFLGINRAQSWEEFTEALRSYHAPMQNFVYADVDGNIGYFAPGAVPIRAAGDGRVPAEGWSGANDWTGYIPHEELPQDVNPTRGYIATANNRLVPDSYPYLISTDWAAPYRAQRIVELIEARPTHSVDDMAALQADVVSLQARDLLPALTSISPEDAQGRAAIDLLKAWDGTMAGDSAAAAVYAAYYHALPEAVFADELRDAYADEYHTSGNDHSIVLERVLLGDLGAWCDDVNTPEAEGCDAALSQALAEGLETMAEVQGTPDVRAWRWDKAHVVVFPHNPFNNVEALRPIFSRTIPNGGDAFTVNVGPIRRTELYRQYNVPSYRQLIDLADLGASRFMHTTGQSGNLLSGAYGDWLERWQRVEYVPIPFGVEVTGDTLTLAP